MTVVAGGSPPIGGHDYEKFVWGVALTPGIGPRDLRPRGWLERGV